MKTTKENPHGTDRKAAAVVGVLFILGTVPALLVLPLVQMAALASITRSAGRQQTRRAATWYGALDAVALALRAHVPILVSQAVMDEAAIVPEDDMSTGTLPKIAGEVPPGPPIHPSGTPVPGFPPKVRTRARSGD